MSTNVGDPITGRDYALHFGWFIPTYGDEDPIGDRSIYPPSSELFTRVVEAAEQAGFEYALVPVSPDCWEAWITCAILAGRSKHLKMLVAARPGYIAPTLMAKMISTFDQLTEGRVLLNLISNTTSADGLYYEHDERYEVMSETLDIMKRVWTEDAPVTYRGKHFQIEGAEVRPRPFQRPWPKFYIGGMSEAAQDVCARHADVQLWWGDTPERIAEQIVDLRARAERLGRDPAELRFGMRLQVIVRETEDEAWRDAWRLIGSTPEHMKERLSYYGRNTDSVTQRRQNELQQATRDRQYLLAPHLWSGISTVRPGAGVAVVGNPEQVAETLQQYIDIGCTEFCLSGYLHDAEAERFGRLVMPYFASRIASNGAVSATAG